MKLDCHFKTRCGDFDTEGKDVLDESFNYVFIDLNITRVQILKIVINKYFLQNRENKSRVFYILKMKLLLFIL